MTVSSGQAWRNVVWRATTMHADGFQTLMATVLYSAPAFERMIVILAILSRQAVVSCGYVHFYLAFGSSKQVKFQFFEFKACMVGILIRYAAGLATFPLHLHSCSCRISVSKSSVTHSEIYFSEFLAFCHVAQGDFSFDVSYLWWVITRLLSGRLSHNSLCSENLKRMRWNDWLDQWYAAMLLLSLLTSRCFFVAWSILVHDFDESRATMVVGFKFYT